MRSCALNLKNGVSGVGVFLHGLSIEALNLKPEEHQCYLLPGRYPYHQLIYMSCSNTVASPPTVSAKTRDHGSVLITNRYKTWLNRSCVCLLFLTRVCQTSHFVIRLEKIVRSTASYNLAIGSRDGTLNRTVYPTQFTVYTLVFVPSSLEDIPWCRFGLVGTSVNHTMTQPS
jgi:hypothetical protein